MIKFSSYNRGFRLHEVETNRIVLGRMVSLQVFYPIIRKTPAGRRVLNSPQLYV